MREDVLIFIGSGGWPPPNFGFLARKLSPFQSVTFFY
jgi:hypothetical protein